MITVVTFRILCFGSISSWMHLHTMRWSNQWCGLSPVHRAATSFVLLIQLSCCASLVLEGYIARDWTLLRYGVFRLYICFRTFIEPSHTDWHLQLTITSLVSKVIQQCLFSLHHPQKGWYNKLIFRCCFTYWWLGVEGHYKRVWVDHCAFESIKLIKAEA